MEEPYKSIYREISLPEGQSEGEILKCAGLYDAIVECINEVKLNNLHPFVDKFHSIVQKLAKSDLISARYFISEILPGMTEGCSELERSDFTNTIKNDE